MASSISAAVIEVIDGYPAGHRFHGNQLKDDAVLLYPESQYSYVDTFLRMARRHRRYAFCVVDQNNSLYEKLAVKSILEEMKEIREKTKPKKPTNKRVVNNQLNLF